jgi:hypothetical protein
MTIRRHGGVTQYQLSSARFDSVFPFLFECCLMLSCICFQLKPRNRELTWKEILARRSDKRVYIELWKSKLVHSRDKKPQEGKPCDRRELRELYDQLHEQVCTQLTLSNFSPSMMSYILC